MKTLLAAGAALGLVMAAAPAIADDHMYEWTVEQKAMYDGWPEDRRTMYDAWPMEAQEYYWTLNADQQSGWWVLNDQQRVRIVGMTPEQRAAAWTSIMNQMSGSTTSATARTAARSASTAGPRFVSKAVVQNIAMDQAQGEVPICGPNDFDNCINSWEARKTGNRPLNYWPGQPASETDD